MNQHQVSQQRKFKKRREKMERRLKLLNTGFYRDPLNRKDSMIIIDPEYKLKEGMVDMRDQFSPVKNQFTLGSCSIFSVISILERKHRIYLSDMFAYYHARTSSKWEGGKGVDIKETTGINLRSALTVMAKKGTCKQTTWPYIKENVFKIPDDKFLEEASNYKVSGFARLEHREVHPEIVLENLKILLEAQIPVICGITLPLQSLSEGIKKTGILPFCWFSKTCHAIVLVGFDESKEQFIFRNSWGKEWGDEGYGYIPYSYIQNRKCYDFWIITDGIEKHEHLSIDSK